MNTKDSFGDALAKALGIYPQPFKRITFGEYSTIARTLGADPARMLDYEEHAEPQMAMYHDWLARVHGRQPPPKQDNDRELLAQGYETILIGDLLSEGLFGNLLKPKTHLYFHPQLKLYAGHVAGKPLKPTTEKGLYKALITHHGHSPEGAHSFIHHVKNGDPTGRSNLKTLDHLSHAIAWAQRAVSAHSAGDHETSDQHMHMVAFHLDKAHDLAHKDLERNPHAFGNVAHPNHPIAKHVKALDSILKAIPD